MSRFFTLVIALFLPSILIARDSWERDIQPNYEYRYINLDKNDRATAIRYTNNPIGDAILYLHGYNDYFFQKELGDSVVSHNFSFYALDLRKYGRSIRKNDKVFDIRKLDTYFEELDSIIRIIKNEGNRSVTLMGHSTGGLIISLYMAKHQNNNDFIKGAILNSPFLDMNLSKFQEKFLVPFVTIIPFKGLSISQGNSNAYAQSLLAKYHGEWDYNTGWKFEVSPKVTIGWLTAIRKGQKYLRKDDVKIKQPILLLHSDKSICGNVWSPEFNTGDSVLDVNDISQYGKKLGENVDEVIIEDGLHDLILSRKDVRQKTYKEIFNWLESNR